MYVAGQLVRHGQLDYLIADYLSEITMSLLAAVKAKRSVCMILHVGVVTVPCPLRIQDMGYTPDFVQSLAPLLGQVKTQGLKVVANAGGINPSACVRALRDAAERAGVELSVAMVTGDDLLPKVWCMLQCIT